VALVGQITIPPRARAPTRTRELRGGSHKTHETHKTHGFPVEWSQARPSGSSSWPSASDGASLWARMLAASDPLVHPDAAPARSGSLALESRHVRAGGLSTLLVRGGPGLQGERVAQDLYLPCLWSPTNLREPGHKHRNLTPRSNVPAKRQSGPNVPDAALTIERKAASTVAPGPPTHKHSSETSPRNRRNRGRVGDTLVTSLGRWHTS